jgi:hypothetical protein
MHRVIPERTPRLNWPDGEDWDGEDARSPVFTSVLAILL